MRAVPRTLLALAGAAALGFAVASACFSPLQVPCAFTCARDHLCPQGFTCGADDLCHRVGVDAECLLTPPDASAADAGDAGQPD
jgi:hypothetical protein